MMIYQNVTTSLKRWFKMI